MPYPVTKKSPNGTPYLITNLWDEAAYQLICVKESVFGGVKNTVNDVADMIVSPVTKQITNITKSLIPILIFVGIGAAIYFFIIKKKVVT